jgi:hypothetical protein
MTKPLYRSSCTTTQPLTVQLSIPSPQNHLTSTNHSAPHCTNLHSITTKPLDQYQPHSPSLYKSPFHHHKTTWPVLTTQPLTVQLSIPSPQNHLTNTNHTASYCTTLHSFTTKPPDQYQPLSPSLYISLQSPTISFPSRPPQHSILKSPQTIIPTMSQFNGTYQKRTINTSTKINIDYDVCQFYMILRHSEGDWRKSKVTTNQHLSCTVKTSQC